MTETDGRKWVTRLMNGYPVLVQPIESATTGIGIPDLWFGSDHINTWAELKVVRFNEKVIRPKWRQGQIPWILRALAKRVDVLLFVFDDIGFVTVFRGGNILQEYTYEDFRALCSMRAQVKEVEAYELYRLLENK